MHRSSNLQEETSGRHGGQPRILWLGTPVSPDDVGRLRGVSPAGAGWQRSLLRRLSECDDMAVRSLGHIPEPAWPRGRLLVSRERLQCPWPATTFSYVNLPFVRMVFLTILYAYHVVKSSRSETIITYNSYVYNAIAALAGKVVSRSKWFGIVADVDGGLIGRTALRLTERLADGCIYLSAALVARSSSRAVLLLEGGVAAPIGAAGVAHGPPWRIAYAGSLTTSAGADRLVQAVKKMARQDVFVDVLGPGDVDALRKMAGYDQRIRIHGLVDRGRLQATLAAAHVLVNPRPTSGEFAVSTFPSKILEYMRYGVPIVSTLSPGLAPRFNDVLIIAESDTPECISRAIEKAIAMDDDRLSEYSAVVASFALTQSWDAQTALLRSFIAAA